MTTREMTAQIKDKRYFRVLSATGKASMLVEVVVLDTRSQFGRLDVLIAPTNGVGEIWVSSDSLKEGI
jgi:hypothetical protein